MTTRLNYVLHIPMYLILNVHFSRNPYVRRGQPCRPIQYQIKQFCNVLLAKKDIF